MILVKKAFSNQILTEHGTQNAEHGTWNSEHGTWNQL